MTEPISLETWRALAEIDPQSTFNKLVNVLGLSFSNAQAILTTCEGSYRTACEFVIEKYQVQLLEQQLAVLKNSISIPPKRFSLPVQTSTLFWFFLAFCVFGLLFSFQTASIMLLYAGVYWVAFYFFQPQSIGNKRILSIVSLAIAGTLYFQIEGKFKSLVPDPFTPTPHSTPRATIVPIITPKNQSASSTCLQWSKITPQMKGQTVCVYGVVYEIISSKETYTRIQFSDEPNRFFLYSINQYYTDETTGKRLSVGECVAFTGKVSLISGIPYIEIPENETLFHCEDWMR